MGYRGKPYGGVFLLSLKDLQSKLAELARSSGLASLELAQLLASHALALVQDWYVKRWKYIKLGVSIDEFADSFCALANLRGRLPRRARATGGA